MNAGGEMICAEDMRFGLDVEDLMTAAMRFSNAHRAYLLTPLCDKFVVYTRVTLEDGRVVATYPHASQLDPYEAAILDQIALSHECKQASSSIRPGSLGAGKDGDLRSMCIAVAGPSGSNYLIYMEAGEQGLGFTEQVIRALELYSVALGRIFDERFYHLGADGGVGRISDRGLTERRRDFDGVDPVILASVAESIAIEVNDALSAIIAHAGAGLQWLNQGSPKVEKARQSFRKIASSTFSVGSIVAAHRKALRPSTADGKPTDLQAVVTDTLKVLEADLRTAGIQCQCELSSSILVEADDKQIQQAIMNVVSISVEALKAVDVSRFLRISSSKEDNFCVLSFSNTGEVIPADARDAIFDPSYTAKQGSRGVKLAIARTIAQLHGGTLDIARASTDCTTMLLRLPLVAQ